MFHLETLGALLLRLSVPRTPSTMRGFSGVLLSHLKPHASLSQLLFLRTMTSKVFVKGLAFSMTEEELAKAFSRYGCVLKANIILNKAKNRSKGFGYVTFAKEEEARKAQIGINGKILHGRVVYVDVLLPCKQKKSFFEEANDG